MSHYDDIRECEYLRARVAEKEHLEKTLERLNLFRASSTDYPAGNHKSISPYIQEAIKELKAQLYDLRNVG